MRTVPLACALSGVLAVTPAAPAAGAALRVPLDHPTISAAMLAASPGDTVQVQGGTYFEQVVLASGVALLGGYDAAFSSRDPSARPTVIHGSDTGAAVTASGASAQTLVDGFRLSGGGGSPGAGVVVTGGSPVFSNNEISGNRLAGLAGGVYISGGSAALFRNNSIRDNSTEGSGAGFHILNSSPVLLENDLQGNIAQQSGGAIYVFQSAITCSASTFSNNLAGTGGGGGIRIQGFTNTPSRIVDCSFDGCRGAFGGGILVRDEASADAVRCAFVDCTTQTIGSPSNGLSGGGALAVLIFSTATFTDCTFDDCHAVAGGSLGGVAYIDQSDVEITGTNDPADSPTCWMIGSSAGGNGGAIAALFSTGTFSRILIEDATAPNLGGGLYLQSSAFNVHECILANCTSTDGGCIALFSASGTPPESFILNNTLVNCSAAPGKGGGIANIGVAIRKLATIAGTLISNVQSGACISCSRNTGGTGSGAKPVIRCTTASLAFGNADSVTVNASCNDAFSAFGGGNRVGDPLFCSSGPPYQLQDCSPDVATNCSMALPGRLNRGATELVCPCGFTTALDESSWGLIKSRYR